MHFVIALVIGVIILQVQAHFNRREEKRTDDIIDYIMNPEKRLRELSEKDFGFGVGRADDEVVIDLQTDGYFGSGHEFDVVEAQRDQLSIDK